MEEVKSDVALPVVDLVHVFILSVKYRIFYDRKIFLLLFLWMTGC